MKWLDRAAIGSLIRQLFSYLLVGGSAAVIEWIVFFLCHYRLNLNETIGTIIAFILATTANWILGRLLTFRKDAAHISKKRDLFGVFFVSLIGLGINILLMLLFVNVLAFHSMFAKICATGIVFVWSFTSRRFIIYKTKEVHING